MHAWCEANLNESKYAYFPRHGVPYQAAAGPHTSSSSRMRGLVSTAARDGHALLLPAGQPNAALAHLRLEALREGADEIVRVGQLRRLLHLRRGSSACNCIRGSPLSASRTMQHCIARSIMQHCMTLHVTRCPRRGVLLRSTRCTCSSQIAASLRWCQVTMLANMPELAVAAAQPPLRWQHANIIWQIGSSGQRGRSRRRGAPGQGRWSRGPARQR